MQTDQLRDLKTQIKDPLLSEDPENSSKESSSSSVLGYTFMTLFIISSSLAHTGSKVLFINHQTLRVDEMLFLRAAIFLGVLLLVMSRDLM